MNKKTLKKDFNDLRFLVARHVKLYFKDKQTFFMSLITPLILVALFATFLRSVYVDSLQMILGEIAAPKRLVNGFVAGWLISSILGTSAVTLAFCSQTIMVSDKVEKRVEDFLITPVKRSVLSLSYFIATVFSTLLVCLACLVLGLLYIAFSGWYLSVTDVLLALATLVLCTLFGALLAVIVETFLKSAGAASAVATLVSSLYGFVCGAYMPISQFSSSIQTFVGFVPGTYGTVLFRRCFLDGAIGELATYLPAEALKGVKDGFDYHFYFNGNLVPAPVCFLILGLTAIILAAVFLLVVKLKSKPKKD
ncbi:MAG: ABC transporter permease [Clostridia bacterium]|nr:ABC transporter permease [Clostridia bacterium]